MPKEPKKIRGWNKKCLALWAKIVKLRDGGKCLHCGSIKFLNSHHLVAKENYRTRYELDNGVTLCVKCHKYDRRKSAHGNPVWFAFWAIEVVGEDRLKRVNKIAQRKPKSPTIPWYRKQLTRLEKEYERFNHE